VAKFDDDDDKAKRSHPDPKVFFVRDRPYVAYRWHEIVEDEQLNSLHFLDL
jgi:hypothetical protein